MTGVAAHNCIGRVEVVLEMGIGSIVTLGEESHAAISSKFDAVEMHHARRAVVAKGVLAHVDAIRETLADAAIPHGQRVTVAHGEVAVIAPDRARPGDQRRRVGVGQVDGDNGDGDTESCW